MDELTFTEKKLLKEHFEVESGFFLNMSDEEFSQFFKQFSVDIDNTKYTSNGEYQIDRFSSCLEIEDKKTVLKILKEAHQYKKHFVEGRRGLVNPTELFLKGIDPLIDTKITDLIDRLSGERKEIQTHTTSETNSSVKPFIGGNERHMSELSNEELTKIIVKAYGALVWKNTPKGKKTKICDIKRSEDFKDLLESLKKQHDIDLSKTRKIVDNSLSAVNPFPQKKKKTL